MHHHRKRSHVSDGVGSGVGLADVGRGAVLVGLLVDGESWGEPALDDVALTGVPLPAASFDGALALGRALGDVDGDADAPGDEEAGAGVPEPGAVVDGVVASASVTASAVSGAAWASPLPEDSVPSSARLRPPAARARPAVARMMRPRRLRCALRVRRRLLR